MSEKSYIVPRNPFVSLTILFAGGLCIAALMVWPDNVVGASIFAVTGLVQVAPLVIPGIILAAWIIASSADSHIARAFEGRIVKSIIAASAIGAITPVCGVTVLPLMAGLLAAGVPLAPVMAFWLSSPVTDPAMLATTAATLGLGFAVGKTIAAFGLGIWGGAITVRFSGRDWARSSLRDNRIVGSIAKSQCGLAGNRKFSPKVWKDPERRRNFRNQFIATARLILICLIPAFVAEYALNALLTPEAFTDYLGEDSLWAIPLAVFVGAPAYVDGYAALPLTRGLIEHGMSEGAAMAFLVSGGVVSIWGALAILPVLKIKPFILYIALAVTGSLLAGYTYDLFT